VLYMSLRQARWRAHPRVEQAERAHARVRPPVEVEQGGRGAVAQGPQHNVPDRGLGALHRVDGRSDVVIQRFEGPRRAAAVTHAPHVETQGRVACSGDGAREQCELAVAADAVLRPAHDHQQCRVGRRHVGRRQRQHADQAVVAAVEEKGVLH
jgi:hypothetical protein